LSHVDFLCHQVDPARGVNALVPQRLQPRLLAIQAGREHIALARARRTLVRECGKMVFDQPLRTAETAELRDVAIEESAQAFYGRGERGSARAQPLGLRLRPGRIEAYEGLADGDQFALTHHDLGDDPALQVLHAVNRAGRHDLPSRGRGFAQFREAGPHPRAQEQGGDENG
jgi:hypothetical protein